MTEEAFVLRPGAFLALEPRAAEFVARLGGRITPADASAFGGNGSSGSRGKSAPEIAVVEIVGLLAPGMPSWLGTDPNEARAAVRDAGLDRKIDGLVLLVDSPGGSVAGIEELAAAVRDVGRSKPTAAIVSGAADSAAYWIASQAKRISVTPSGETGSIGVYALHQDLSAMLEKEGVRMSLIASKASPHKTEANPFQALSEPAAEHMQGEVDRIADLFIADVMRGRAVSRDRVEVLFGGGRTVDARESVRRGMADEVATPEQAAQSFLARLGERALAIRLLGVM